MHVLRKCAHLTLKYEAWHVAGFGERVKTHEVPFSQYLPILTTPLFLFKEMLIRFFGCKL